MMGTREDGHGRTETDHNLRTERERTDQELLTRTRLVVEDNDEVVRRARERARAVLEVARTREDAQLARDGVSADVHAHVAEERATADQMVAAEHAVADATLADERERRRLAVLALLALERTATDEALDSERARADEESLARDSLIAAVAHDLRGMLSTVLTSAAVVVLSDDRRVTLDRGEAIQRAGAQMSVLLTDLLDYAVIAAGEMRLQRATVDLVGVAHDAVAVHASAAQALGVTLTLEVEAAPVRVDADEARLGRVLLNLLGNALKFSPYGGCVTVRVSHAGDRGEVSVADTGPGIASDELSTIFEPFERGAVARGAPGTGLGLHVAASIAQAHGGRLSVDSAPGRGATFVLSIPALLA